MEEALQMRAEHGVKSCILAGGTDVLIKMRRQVIQPDFVIGFNSIPNIDYIQIQDGNMAIGTMAKLTTIAENAEIIKNFPALAYSAGVTATVQVRNMSTLVGNICNASPSADNATPLLIYDTQVVIVSTKGEKVVSLDKFFAGPGKSILQPDEIVKGLILELPAQKTGSSFQKISTRSRVDIAGVCASALITLDAAGKIAKARIAIGSVAPIPLRVYKAEEKLEGQKPTPEIIEKAALIAQETATPISDMRASSDYRKAMIKVLSIRAIEESIELASKKKN
jgi:carbon-monoxide dehydrogenase medium subunit